MGAHSVEVMDYSSDSRPSLFQASGDTVVNHLLLIQGELQALRRELHELRADRQPKGRLADAEWLKPGDMAAILNVPVRTLQGWHRRNRVPVDAIKQVTNGRRVDNLFHRERMVKAVSSGVVYGAAED